MRWIISPESNGATNESLTGGKGASLARLVSLGARVPPFVVVSTEAWRAMAATGPDSSLVEEVREALKQLDDSNGLAVRSSAVGEDAADASFAGLYHTSLEVRGLEAVMEAIQTCWRSYHDAHAAAYREERTGEESGGMGVVIQQMILGDWSGVSFTANPVTQALSETVINSVPGLGEALVSGEVNPEEIIVSTPDGSLRKRKGGDAASPLPDEAIAEIWSVSNAIAGQLDFPQDLEWAWRSGVLYILQSRPITTIADVFFSRSLEPWRNDPCADPDRPDRIWSRMLADETWVSPISPLFYNIHNSTPGRVAFIRSHGDTTPLPPDIFKYHMATAYADIELIERMYSFQPRLARIQAVLNFLPKEHQEKLADAKWHWAGRLRRMLSYELRERHWRSFFRNFAWVNAQWPPYEAVSDRWFDTDLDTLSLEELRQHQAEQQGWMARVGPPCAIAVLSHASDIHLLLTGLLNRWCRHLGSDGENLYARISAGLDGSETVREAQQLWTIAQTAREIGLSFDTHDWQEFSAAAVSETGRQVVREFEAFWRSHRHLGANYKDVVWPRWGDDINACYAVMKGYAGSASIEPAKIHAQSAAQRRAAQQEILASVSPWKRGILRWLFKYNERYMSVRDNHRHYVDRNWFEVRRIYRSYGRRLKDAGILTDSDEVFFLGTDEIEQALCGRMKAADAARRIEVRRRVWTTTLRSQGPKFLKGWAPYRDAAGAPGAAHEIRGIAASPGTAVGTARVVYDVSGLSAVRDGEILVTRQTDPSWTSVFGRIGGLVLETGGVLSHGTSLCREYGLPCVTAVEQATVRIPDGAPVELIGDAGLIRLIRTAPTPDQMEKAND